MIVAVIAMFAGYNIYQSQRAEGTMSNLALANVEALAEGGETSSTWKCSGWWGDCYAHCGLCGTTIEGDGDQTGDHSCSVNK